MLGEWFETERGREGERVGGGKGGGDGERERERERGRNEHHKNERSHCWVFIQRT